VIAIVDYQAGNLASVKKAFDHLGAASRITSDPDFIRSAAKIVLPGVGHFAATETLNRGGLCEAIAGAIEEGVPFLGICVGMQWLFDGSEESLPTKGLGLFAGKCTRFDSQMKVPHVGWNQIEHRAESKLLRGIASGAFAYYTHSYRAPVIDGAVATSQYGGAFAAIVESENVFGVQFHPEKSAAFGLLLLKNFCELPC
jgi:glutamine amidotransferase